MGPHENTPIDNAALLSRVSELEDALKQMKKHCYCNRLKGYDYGEKHPRLGKCERGRWLSPSEIADVALLLVRRQPHTEGMNE